MYYGAGAYMTLTISQGQHLRTGFQYVQSAENGTGKVPGKKEKFGLVNRFYRFCFSQHEEQSRNHYTSVIHS